jgi:hypothetical protein
MHGCLAAVSQIEHLLCALRQADAHAQQIHHTFAQSEQIHQAA